MKRREFLAASAAIGAAAVAPTVSLAGPDAAKKHRFKLKYAPHFNMFKHSAGDDPIDQLKFAADQGFTAWEDNGMKKRPVELQEKIARTMEQLGMQMGVFVAHGSIGKLTFARKDKDVWDAVLKDIQDSIEVAKRVNAKWMTVVPGNVDETGRNRLAMGYQTANVIELLRRCSDLLEPHQLVMVLEPLNWFANHGGTFLQGSPQAYAICKAVNSPSCKILFDVYHQQITEGNLIPNIEKCWDEIGYFQCGDNPGRKEPGTGEINYRNIFKYIHSRKFEGVLGMEHGNSGKGAEGEQAVIDAYVDADNF
ncbi:MAG TPA: xylose isomerase [Planctomycetaceae bacterium]|nr:xylose isomerase [Blastopirellula sp.]HAY81835.1 xylose isomerase [Planctomycetaceae bacterium]